MWFMYILSWLATILQLCFITLSIAAGLYYLAELVEEFTVLTGKIIKYLIWFTIAINVCLLVFEDIPLMMTILSLATDANYLILLQSFPFVEFTSPFFILSVLLLVANHYFTFAYFSEVWHPFSEVLGYFTICVWLVPFAFFVSLSVNEHVLPTSMDKPHSAGDDMDGDIVSNYFKKKNKGFGLLTALKTAQETLLPQRLKKAF